MAVIEEFAVNDLVVSPLRVAVLEVDAVLRERILVPRLRDHGFDVVGLGTAAALEHLLVTHRPDIIVLDEATSALDPRPSQPGSVRKAGDSGRVVQPSSQSGQCQLRHMHRRLPLPFSEEATCVTPSGAYTKAGTGP